MSNSKIRLLDPYTPITWRDLENLRKQKGMLVRDFNSLIGLAPKRWTDMKKHPDDPIPDPSIALLVRIVDTFPEVNWVPRFPKPQEIYDKLSQIAADHGEHVSHTQFSIAMGRDATSARRYLTLDGNTGPFVARMLYSLMMVISHRGYEGWQRWQELGDMEAQARGITNIWEEGKWGYIPYEDASEDENKSNG